MGYGHGHGHGHTEPTAAAAHRGRLAIVLLLTTVVLVVEALGAVLSGSLALLADAGHMATDAAGVALALFAIWVAGKPASAQRTFGYQRAEILAAAINAVVLLALSAYILYEAVRRFADPEPVGGTVMLVAAVAGLVANAIGLWLLRRGQAESLNLRGAYLEVLGDLLGSVAVIVAAVVIALTGWTTVDPIVSVVIALLIVPRTWSLLREAVNILLEAAPKGVDLEEVRRHLMEAPGVLDVHDLHAWTITSGVPVMSAHVVVEERVLADGAFGQVLDRLHECLAGHFDVEHSTLQLEPAGHAGHEGARHR
ncbi:MULTISPECIES: cation diffusion facilitator family transporter [Streptosporangium]|uniref:Cobalt-zinc-cadmium efflux system protein n=1 Tax=Streptosporangium brasiliense TaxID=47480 RepID=A0ABT9RF02_9ACTN|nr:cation diffusion facilitator family transporter [Streptosporangium brasiliense]MDP9867842.1 cobalt-zinc-cadmium efflux system protein [Streptosporangium brasiliense]